MTIYNWLKQDRVDRGEEEGKTTEQQLELAAARKRISQLETELAVSRKINEVFLKEGVTPKRLFPVIASLAGQGINIEPRAARWRCRCRATTRGRTGRTHRGSSGGSG